MMWTLVMFDLPSVTAKLRRRYGQFRKDLLKLGFGMMQKSIYLRWEDSDVAASTLRRNVLLRAPEDGTVMVLAMTERTMHGMSLKVDGEMKPPIKQPQAFEIF